MPRYRQTELGRFLRNRRERLTPRDVGLVAGERRRTPGLRRDEVAALASMSSDYYERLEQARGPQPSPAMLGAISRALRLTLDERDHVFLLAGHPAPPPHVADGYADPGLMTVLSALAPRTPAMIVDGLNTVIAQNPLNVALLGELAGRRGLDANFTWHWFTDPAYAAVYAPNDRDELGRGYVADLRVASVQRDDAASAELVEALLAASDDFRAIWELQEVAAKTTTRKRMQHPSVGLLDFECDVVLSPPSQQRLVLFRPNPGSDTADRLDMLGVIGTQEFTTAR